MADPSNRNERTDEELAVEAGAGSQGSFDELALRYRRRLFVYFRPRLGSDQDAEDMVQDTFLKLYEDAKIGDVGNFPRYGGTDGVFVDRLLPRIRLQLLDS